MSDGFRSVLWVLCGGWFIIYWILGGVVFALVAAARSTHMRKAQFSCLFTLGSAAAAYGAAAIGLLLLRPRGPRCPEEFLLQKGFMAAERIGLQDVLFCDAKAIMIAGGLCFALLLAVGVVALLVSSIEKSKKI